MLRFSLLSLFFVCFSVSSTPLVLYPTSVEVDNSNQSNPYETQPILPDIQPTPVSPGGFAAEGDEIPFMADFTEMPDFYPETSAPGFGDSIDPRSRTLRIVHTDAVLRTNGGLDISITRAYQHINDGYFLKEKRGRYNNLNSAVGLGWQMHFGRFMWSNKIDPCDTKYHFMFEGQSGGLQQFFFHKGSARWVSKQLWTGSCEKHGSDYAFTAKSPDGKTFTANYNIRYYNVQQAYVNNISDTNGNTIDIAWGKIGYDASGKTFETPYIVNVKSDDGHVIDYVYDLGGNRPRIQSIKVPGLKAITYETSMQNRHSGQSSVWQGSTYPQLDKVNLPSGKSWIFGYHDGAYNNGRYLLDKQVHPDGGEVEYFYKKKKDETYIRRQELKTAEGEKHVRKFFSASFANEDLKKVEDTYKITISHPDSSRSHYYYFARSYHTTPDSNGNSDYRYNPRWLVGELKMVQRGYRWDYHTYTPYKISEFGYYSSLDPKKRKDDATYLPVLSEKNTYLGGHTIDTRNQSTAFKFEYEYANDPSGANFSGLNPTKVTVTGANGKKVTDFAYHTDIDRYGIRLKSEKVSGIYGDISHEIDAKGNVTAVNRFGIKTTYTHYDSGETKTVTDANGNETTYEAYVHGIPTKALFPEDTSISRKVVAPGLVTESVDPMGNKTTYSYDDAGRVTAIVPVDLAQTTFSYQQNKNVVARGRLCLVDETDGLGRTTKRISKAFSQGVSAESCASASGSSDTWVTINYDPLGRTDFISLPNKTIGTTTTYLPDGRVVSVCLDARCTKYNHLEKNQVEVTDAEGHVQTLTYRGIGDDKTLIKSVQQVDDNRANDITVEIDKNNLNQTTEVRSHGLRKEYVYDSRQLLTGIIDDQVRYHSYDRETYTYDSVGNLVGLTGRVTAKYTLDKLYRTKRIQYSDQAGSVTYDYDKNGRVTSANRHYEASAWKKTYEHNRQGQVTKLTHTLEIPSQRTKKTFSVGYAYNGEGHKTSTTYPTGRVISYAPDAYGRPTKAGTFARDVSYFPAGGMSSYTLGNGKSVSYGLDEYNRVSSILVPNVFSRTYGYDKADNLISKEDSIALNSTAITYDHANRLLSEVGKYGQINLSYYPDQSIKTLDGFEFGYKIDKFGRLWQWIGSKEGLVDNTKMTLFHKMRFDDRGNVNFISSGDYVYNHRDRSVDSHFKYASDGMLQSAYNRDVEIWYSLPPSGVLGGGDVALIGVQSLAKASNRLKPVDPRVNKSFWERHYAYDADNQRIAIAKSLYRQFFINGSEGLLAEYNNEYKPMREYVYLGGRAIAQLEDISVTENEIYTLFCVPYLFCDGFEVGKGKAPKDVSTGGTKVGAKRVSYLHHDILGTPVAATDDTGQVLWRNFRLAYGGHEEGKDAGKKPDYRHYPIGYTGHYEDDRTGLTYAQARYYHKDYAMFMALDPLHFRESDLTSVNRYVYASNNPYKYVDPTGGQSYSSLDYIKQGYLGIVGGTKKVAVSAGNGAAGAADEVTAGASTWALGEIGLAIDTNSRAFRYTAYSVMALTSVKGLAQRGVKQGFKRLLKGSPCSFKADTLVATPQGLKPIAELNEGDYVMSRDELTGQVTAKQITHKFVEWHDNDVRELTVSNGLIETVIITSDEHPFYVLSKGFIPASELKSSDQLVSLDFNVLKIISNKRIDESMLMYNFEVADFHTYAVSEQNVWVHNDCLFGKNFPKKVRKHIDQVRKRYDGQIDDIPAPGKGGIEKVQEIIKNRVSQGNGYRSTYAGEPADFYPDGKVAYVVKESGEFWTILKNTKYNESH